MSEMLDWLIAWLCGHGIHPWKIYFPRDERGHWRVVCRYCAAEFADRIGEPEIWDDRAA